jgi:hypothetical protein
LALGRELLARQLQAMSSSSSLQRLALARRDADFAGRVFGRRGAVGYMPVIIILPSGTNMQVTQAVVSPDRRYVRVTPQPFISDITRVDTFTFNGGNVNIGGGGGGGGGGMF